MYFWPKIALIDLTNKNQTEETKTIGENLSQNRKNLSLKLRKNLLRKEETTTISAMATKTETTTSRMIPRRIKQFALLSLVASSSIFVPKNKRGVSLNSNLQMAIGKQLM